MKNSICAHTFQIYKKKAKFTHGSKRGGMESCIVKKPCFRKYLHVFKAMYELIFGATEEALK